LKAIEMSVDSLTAFGIARSMAPLAWVPPRGFGARLAALGPLATAFLNVRQLLEALKGTPRNGPMGGGPQESPEEDHLAADLERPRFLDNVNTLKRSSGVTCQPCFASSCYS
jgi:hypothetical protein